LVIGSGELSIIEPVFSEKVLLQPVSRQRYDGRVFKWQIFNDPHFGHTGFPSVQRKRAKNSTHRFSFVK
jgi:hypothetical protein